MRPLRINRSYAIATPFPIKLGTTLTRSTARDSTAKSTSWSSSPAWLQSEAGRRLPLQTRRSTIDRSVKRGNAMMHEINHRALLSRRSLLAGTAGLAGAAAVTGAARAQQNAKVGTPATVISNPPRDLSRGHPSIYPDPDVIVVDPSFLPLRRGQGAIYRLWTGAYGPRGRHGRARAAMSCSATSRATCNTATSGTTVGSRVFRRPSYNSNGNTFDFQGRQISCEHFNRRVVRWEHDGSMTVIADSYEGKPLNSPNDVVPHPDGSIWFTDPPYGGPLAEGHPDEAGGPTNPEGLLQSADRRRDAGRDRRQQAGIVDQRLSLGPERQARCRDHRGPAGRPERPLLFARLQDALRDQHRQRPRRLPGPAARASIYAFDVQGTKVANSGCSPT